MGVQGREEQPCVLFGVVVWEQFSVANLGFLQKKASVKQLRILVVLS